MCLLGAKSVLTFLVLASCFCVSHLFYFVPVFERPGPVFSHVLKAHFEFSNCATVTVLGQNLCADLLDLSQSSHDTPAGVCGYLSKLSYRGSGPYAFPGKTAQNQKSRRDV